MSGVPRRGLLFGLFLWTLAGAPAGGDELESWFASDPRAGVYMGMQAELQELIAGARLREVPVDPLIDKLREGASKGADGGRLLDTLRETVDRLARARSILEQASGRIPAAGEDVQAISLLLLRGLSDELARGMIAHGLRAGRRMQDVRAACHAVASLLEAADLEAPEALNVGLKTGTLLLDGRLPVSDYESLASVFLQARAAGLQDSEILDDVIIATLESGGRIASMDRKIRRRQGGADGDRKPGRPPPAGPPKQPPGQDKKQKG